MSTETAVAVHSSHGQPAGAANLPAVGASHDIPTSSSPTVPAKRKPRVRVRPPKDSKIAKIAIAAVALKAQGLKGPEVAERLNVPYDTMRTYLRRAVQRGWLQFNSFSEQEDKVELVLADKAITNANELLRERFTDDDGEQRLTNRAMEMTMETLKGTGVFKQHQAMKVENTQQLGFALKVQIEMPPMAAGQSPIQIRPGTVGGAFGTAIPTDAEIVEGQVE